MACDPNKETAKSIWKVLPGGTHAKIAAALAADDAVKAALAKVKAAPSDKKARTDLIDIVTRDTGNCIGQALVHQSLQPGDDQRSVFKVLKPGTEASIATAIGSDKDEQLGLKDPPASPDAKKGPVFAISRMTGRCVGESLDNNLIDLIKKLAHL